MISFLIVSFTDSTCGTKRTKSRHSGSHNLEIFLMAKMSSSLQTNMRAELAGGEKEKFSHFLRDLGAGKIERHDYIEKYGE